MTQTATTLTADLSLDAEHLNAVAAISDDEVDGYYVQIGTEILEVIYRGTKTNPGIRRGRLGTTPAAHSATDDVIPVKVVVQTDAPTAPPPATAGGAAQNITLLSYPIAFDTEGIDGTGGDPALLADGGYVQLAAVPDGAVVVGAWVEVVTPFNGGTDRLNIDFQPDGDPDNSSDVSGPYSLTYQDTTAPTVFAVSKIMKAPAFALPGWAKVPRSIVGASLMVYLASDAPPTIGEAVVYVMIATPA